MSQIKKYKLGEVIWTRDPDVEDRFQVEVDDLIYSLREKILVNMQATPLPEPEEELLEPITQDIDLREFRVYKEKINEIIKQINQLKKGQNARDQI